MHFNRARASFVYTYLRTHLPTHFPTLPACLPTYLHTDPDVVITVPAYGIYGASLDEAVCFMTELWSLLTGDPLHNRPDPST